MATPRIPRDMNRLAQSYRIGAPDGVIATPVGGGRPRFALDWDRGVVPFQVSMLLNRSQFTVWNLFFFRVIKKGAIMFEMNLDSGMGEEIHNVNIVPGTYSAASAGPNLRSVSFSVVAEPPLYDLTDAQVQEILDIYEGVGPDIGLLLNRLAIFANVDTTEAFDY